MIIRRTKKVIGELQERVQTLTDESQRLQAQLEEARCTPARKRLPDTRRSITHKFEISETKGYLTVGLFEDGTPGELFVKVAKEGSTIAGLCDAVGILTSMALQFGMPLEAIADKLSHSRFEPAGYTRNPDIRIAKSVVDYMFRWLRLQFSDTDNEDLSKAYFPERDS